MVYAIASASATIAYLCTCETAWRWLLDKKYRRPDAGSNGAQRTGGACPEMPRLSLNVPLYSCVRAPEVSIEDLTRQIAAADVELSMNGNADATYERLMTGPGVEPATAMRFRATVDDVGRF